MAPEAERAVADVLASGFIGQGPKVEEFEQALQETLDCPYPPLTTNSCTSALDLALHLIGVGPGDEVISTPMTCTATNGVIVNRGAQIVWADVNPFSGLISPEDVGRLVSRRTKAIMAVDWGGKPCDYETLCCRSGSQPRHRRKRSRCAFLGPYHGLPGERQEISSVSGCVWR